MAVSVAIITDLFKFARIIALVFDGNQYNQSLDIRNEALAYIRLLARWRLLFLLRLDRYLYVSTNLLR